MVMDNEMTSSNWGSQRDFGRNGANLSRGGHAHLLRGGVSDFAVATPDKPIPPRCFGHANNSRRDRSPAALPSAPPHCQALGTAASQRTPNELV